MRARAAFGHLAVAAFRNSLVLSALPADPLLWCAAVWCAGWG